MKHLLLALMPFLFIMPVMAQMQPPPPTIAELAAGQESATPFKGANVILLHTPDSSAVALKKMARALILAGIEPDKLEIEIGYLTTKGKAVGQLTPAMFQYKVVSSPEPGGTLLTITGDFTVRISLVSSMTVPMHWTPGNGNQGKICFATIEPVALSYPKGRIGYKSRPERPAIH